MKRNILIALFTLMLGFTGTVNASDVVISSHVEPSGSGGSRFLKPLNPQYPLITDEFDIIILVIGMYV